MYTKYFGTSLFLCIFISGCGLCGQGKSVVLIYVLNWYLWTWTPLSCLKLLSCELPVCCRPSETCHVIVLRPWPLPCWHLNFLCNILSLFWIAFPCQWWCDMRLPAVNIAQNNASDGVVTKSVTTLLLHNQHKLWQLQELFSSIIFGKRFSLCQFTAYFNLI